MSTLWDKVPLASQAHAVASSCSGTGVRLAHGEPTQAVFEEPGLLPDRPPIMMLRVGDLLPLEGVLLDKAQLWMRALRRRTIDYWYATTEGPDAAHIEASAAAVVVSVLDNVVFEEEHRARYVRLRDAHPRGRVVLGLQLIRNAEIHSSEIVALGERALFSIPDLGFRQVLTWPTLDELPDAYRRRITGENRARGPARDAYRKWVSGRPIAETLLDAVAFFEALEPRLIPARQIELKYSFIAPCPLGTAGETLPSKPMFLDTFELDLPDLATRPWEGRSPSMPPADKELNEVAKRARREVPSGSCREVQGQVVDADGKLIGYRGFSGRPRSRYRAAWVERVQQVARDVRRGFRYFVVADGVELDLGSAGGRSLHVVDTDNSALDALLARESERWLDHLRINEDAPELYLMERRSAE